MKEENHINGTPLAERMRPESLEDFVGQEHILAQGKIVRTMIDKGAPFSVIFWGEPGSGKTTLAKIIALQCGMDYYFLSAISAGVADVRKIIEHGKENRAYGKNTLLFIDEIHRFNKAQQDAVLGAVESGDVILIGATTENPSFSVISPLLSRTRVVRLNKHTENDLLEILNRAVQKDILFAEKKPVFDENVREKIVSISGGDARRMLNILESSYIISKDGKITESEIEEAVKNSVLYYDKTGDKHYDTISAFIKSMRGSDPDAALYYLARMILSGEDPEFIARRMVIFASEDIGNASPAALNLAVSAMTAVKNIGLPEAEIILSQCVAFLASSPKSNSAVVAIGLAKKAATVDIHEIPMHLRNAPTDLMKKSGYGSGYKYPHDYEGHFVKETYLPEKIKNSVFYFPGEEGSEKSIKDRLLKLWPWKYNKKN